MESKAKKKREREEERETWEGRKEGGRLDFCEGDLEMRGRGVSRRCCTGHKYPKELLHIAQKKTDSVTY